MLESLAWYGVTSKCSIWGVNSTAGPLTKVIFSVSDIAKLSVFSIAIYLAWELSSFVKLVICCFCLLEM